MAEAASAGELALALNSGVPAGRLLLGGPAKGRRAIEGAARSGIAGVLVESATELARVKAVATEVGATLDVLLRVNPDRLSSTSVLRMGGLASPFGIDEELLPQVVRECVGDGVRYAGLFLYAGSQHFSTTDIVDNTRYLCRLCRRLCAEGFPPAKVLDFGGGFGVPEDDSQSDLDLSQLKEGLARVFSEEARDLARLGLERTVFESGRYLVGRAGVYIAPWPSEVLVAVSGCERVLRRRGLPEEACGIGYTDPLG